MADAVVFQIIFQPVCDISFCDGADVNGGMGIQKLNNIVFNQNILIIHMTCGFRNSLCGRRDRLVGMKIPQIRYRSNRNIKGAVGQIAVIDGFLNQSDSLRGYFDGSAACVIDTGDLAVLHLIREHGIIFFTDLFTAFQDVLAGRVVYFDADYCVKHCVDLLLFLRKAGTTGQKKKSRCK